MLKFYADEVAIDTATRETLHNARIANETRLEEGLAKARKPKVRRHQQQGGYAMKTVVQRPKNDFDIDNGAIFAANDLKTAQGNPMSALDARKMARDAIDDGSFKTPPEVKRHCVRIHYADGYHVDVPVYRETDTMFGRRLEIAGPEWKHSDPQGVNDWFEGAVNTKSPDSTNDRQMRRVVAYLKALGKSRESWDAPTGFMISVLVDECYRSRAGRDDAALRDTMKAIRDRLKSNLRIRHPKVDEYLTEGDKDSSCIFFRDKLSSLLDDLGILDDPNCAEADAARAWDKVFATSYFSDRIAESAKRRGFSTGVAATVPAVQFVRSGDRQYG